MSYVMTSGLGAEDFATPSTRGTSAATPVGTGWFTRLVEAMMESRMRKAERELRRYRHLLPASFDLENGISPRSLPFNR